MINVIKRYVYVALFFSVGTYGMDKEKCQHIHVESSTIVKTRDTAMITEDNKYTMRSRQHCVEVILRVYKPGELPKIINLVVDI